MLLNNAKPTVCEGHLYCLHAFQISWAEGRPSGASSRVFKQTKSISQASKLCEVSYNTFRKYAKLYKNDEGVSLFEEFKNQPGIGINKPKNLN